MARYRWYVDRDPFLNEFSRLQREMSRLWSQNFPEEQSSSEVGLFPLVNIFEDQDNYFLTAEIPGLAEKDLDLSVVSDQVTIKGERKLEQKEDVNYHRRERSGGAFSRVVSFADRIDPEKVEASLKNGVLTLKLTKAEESKPKKIKVKID